MKGYANFDAAWLLSKVFLKDIEEVRISAKACGRLPELESYVNEAFWGEPGLLAVLTRNIKPKVKKIWQTWVDDDISCGDKHWGWIESMVIAGVRQIVNKGLQVDLASEDLQIVLVRKSLKQHLQAQ